jgi:hypothetical protein
MSPLYSLGSTTAVHASSSRRFAPVAGFLCGAAHLEATGEGCALIWRDGSCVPYPAVTLARALRLVARGTWVELPAIRVPSRR